MRATPWVKISKEGTFMGFLNNMDNERRRSTSSITDLIWCGAVKRDSPSAVCPCGSGPLVCEEGSCGSTLGLGFPTLLRHSFQVSSANNTQINRRLLNTLNSLQQEIDFWRPVYTDAVFLRTVTYGNRRRCSDYMVDFRAMRARVSIPNTPEVSQLCLCSYKLCIPGTHVRGRLWEPIVITGNVDLFYLNKILLWCDMAVAFMGCGPKGTKASMVPRSNCFQSHQAHSTHRWETMKEDISAWRAKLCFVVVAFFFFF